MKDKKNLWIVILLSLIALFIFLLIMVKLGRIEAFDNYVYSLFSIKEKLTPVVKVITFFGSSTLLIVLSCIILVVVKVKRIGMLVPINLVMIAALNHLMKVMVQRSRPVGINLIVENGYSFPSGHSATSFAFYGFLIYLIWKYVANKKLKVVLTIFLSILILLIGLSRIYLGVHYASDVIAGFTFGGIYLIIFIKVCKTLRDKT